MKLFLLVAAATLCFAATEPRVSTATIVAVEGSLNQKLSEPVEDPYDQLGKAHGTYLEGYGTVFTSEIDLISAGPIISPFKPTISDAEKNAVLKRKLKKLATLKDDMRSLMVNASGTLEGLPPNERVAIEVTLFNWGWELTRGLPHRVFMSAEKQKLIDAKKAHAGLPELAGIIEEQER